MEDLIFTGSIFPLLHKVAFCKKAYYQEKTTMAIGGVSKSCSWIADKNNWIALTVRYQLSFGQNLYKPQRNIGGNTSVDTGVKL